MYSETIAAAGQRLFDSIFDIHTPREANFLEVEVEKSFDVLDPRVIQFLEVEALEHIRMINVTTKKKLQKQLIEGVDAGESIPKLTKRIESVFGEAAGYRAKTIARTEVIRASNFGSWEGMHQAGAEQKEWLATRDERVRDEHLNLDGQIQPTDKPFVVFGGSAMYPGDFGVAELDVNCRCTIAVVFTERSIYDTEEKRLAAWNQWDKGVRPWEGSMLRAVRSGFREQQEMVLKELKEGGD